MKRIVLVVAVLALIVPSAFFFEEREDTKSVSISGSFMENVRIVNKVSGKDRWSMEARKVEIPDEGNSSRLSLVAIYLPEHTMNVVSEAGLYDFESRDLTLSGNIEARTEDYVLKTDAIHLESETGVITSPQKVILEGNNFKVEGDGFKTNGKRKVTFNSNVKATFF